MPSVYPRSSARGTVLILAFNAQRRSARSVTVKQASPAGGRLCGVGRRADPALRVIRRICGDDVEGWRFEREGGEAFVELHRRLLDVPLDLVAGRILRQHAAKRGRASAIGLQK